MIFLHLFLSFFIAGLVFCSITLFSLFSNLWPNEVLLGGEFEMGFPFEFYQQFGYKDSYVLGGWNHLNIMWDFLFALLLTLFGIIGLRGFRKKGTL